MKDMTAALIVMDGRILLVHNTKHNGLRIEPPGGKKEEGETLEECVVREVREELGLEINPTKLFGMYATNSPEGEFKVYMYLSEIASGNPKVMEKDKISAFGWYTMNEVIEFKERGILVPNMCAAIDGIKKFLTKDSL
jgi:8-oxo-dGTP diphosphatase